MPTTTTDKPHAGRIAGRCLLEIGADAVIFSVDYPYESNHEAVAGLEWFAKHMN